MGHVECRLIHACSFFFHDRTTCMHGLIVCLTVNDHLHMHLGGE